ncbi:THO complex subunit 7 homolog isoform X2 [Dermacentor albipictus]|uniref:THO complex subunit 7 homolog isoform X2 n=1 Tax=Dermacentor albipictus TaxID=60249 RepID=UPI0038FC5C5B
MAPVSEDEIIRRKLLIDGDGMGDDRRLNMLLKVFLKWCMTDDDTEEENKMVYERMLMTLAQCEFSISKSQHVLAMNDAEMKNYEQLYREIVTVSITLGIWSHLPLLTPRKEVGIANAQKNIVENKLELQKAKSIRKNKQEYDALAKVIAKQPDRRGMLSQLECLEKEIHSLQQSQQALDSRLEHRRRQFHVLLTSVCELGRILKDEENGDVESQAMDTA